MSKSETIPHTEEEIPKPWGVEPGSTFGIRHSGLFRISTFGFRISRVTLTGAEAARYKFGLARAALGSPCPTDGVRHDQAAQPAAGLLLPARRPRADRRRLGRGLLPAL